MGKGTPARRPLLTTHEPADPHYWERIRVLSIRHLAKHGVQLPPDSGKPHVAALTAAHEKAARKRPGSNA